MCMKCGNDIFCYCGQHNEKTEQKSKLNDGVMAPVEYLKRINRKLSTMSDEEAASFLDKIFDTQICTPADEKLMKQIAELVEGVEP